MAHPRRLSLLAQPQGLGRLLKHCRNRIPPEQSSLGFYLRLPSRVGKPITQEEVAEVVGISRQWYVLLESDRRLRVSAAVLGRIAEALMMDAAEREMLFRLGFGELRSTLNDRTVTTLEAITSLRCITRRLWAASTAAQTLQIAREYAITQLSSDVMVSVTRVGEGQWEHATTGDPDNCDRVTRFNVLVRERLGSRCVDDLYCFPLVAQTGDVVTRADYNARFPGLAAEVRPALDAVRLCGSSFAAAQVRAQNGFAALLSAVYTAAHDLSELERAHLGALADLTSLALSGRAGSESATTEVKS